MQLKINKFAASLLTLLLALTPLQGVVAATAAAGDAHVMMMAEGEPMHHVDAEAAAAFSRSCGVSPATHD